MMGGQSATPSKLKRACIEAPAAWLETGTSSAAAAINAIKQKHPQKHLNVMIGSPKHFFPNNILNLIP
jgi:hypothetical protein